MTRERARQQRRSGTRGQNIPLVDVINGKSVDDAMAACAEAFGQIDLLGSNAEDLSVTGVPDIDAYECCRVIGYHGGVSVLASYCSYR